MNTWEMSSQESDASEAIREALDLLEWPEMCEHISSFASTTRGCHFCQSLPIPIEPSVGRALLEETKEISFLDEVIEGGLNFQGVHDLRSTLRLCIKGGIASGEELLQIAETLSSARRIRRLIDDGELRPVLTESLVDLVTLPLLERNLKFGLEEGGRVADRASKMLTSYRGRIKSLRKERSDCFHELLRLYGNLLNDNVIADRNGRPVVAVKVGAAQQFPGVALDSSSSGNTVFMEPQKVIPLGNEIAEFEVRVHDEEKRLLAGWSKEVAENVKDLEVLGDILTHLDVALARSRYSRFLSANPPELQEKLDSPISLKGLRHPILVWRALKGKGQAVTPVSVEISPELRVVAITGPNTGGKTVTLKTIGLSALMVRAGLFLPCQGVPVIPWFRNVFADIGDDQSLHQNLSTFSGHIKRIGRILNALSWEPGNSLVLLDEIGAGTDPSEGTALAISLLQTFANNARLTIATTHFGALKALKYNDSRFENASVAFDAETMSPTYELQWGIPGQSNALLIASRLGLSDEIISEAKELLDPKKEGDVNKVIQGLAEQRTRQQEATENAAALLARAELLHEQLLNRWEKQCYENAQRKETERRKLEAYIQEGQEEVKKLIRDLRKTDANGETARVVGQRLRRIEAEHQPHFERNQEVQWQPRVGDTIRLLALGKAGEVLEVSDDGLHLTVRCGVLRSKVDLGAVESLDGIKPTPPQPIVKVQSSLATSDSPKLKTLKNTVDVRGLRVHEAEVVVEEALRTASGCIWIIHGIGTGKLKRGLREWLESTPYIQSVRDAEQRDGGAGCTVVWLK